MAKDIIMQVLTSAGYEPMYPFNPSQVLNGTCLATSTNVKYNVTVSGIPTPLTNTFGNKIGIISFKPTINNMDNVSISINGGEGLPLLMADGTNVRANTLIKDRNVFIKYYNGNFYLLLDKNQVGLGNVQNISPEDMPISTAVANALNSKLNTPIAIPSNANLNNYKTAGLYYCASSNTAATIANVPIQLAFSLFVEQHAGVKQTFTNYNASTGIQTWVRNFYNGTWSQWYQQAYVLYGNSEPTANLGMNGNLYLKINS